MTWGWSSLRFASTLGIGGLCGVGLMSNIPINVNQVQLPSKEKLNEKQIDLSEKQVDIHSNELVTKYQQQLKKSIKRAEKICERFCAENGLPGLAVAISVNGQVQMTKGFGYSDLENEVNMKSDAVFRIGSISKSMTMAMLAPLMEQGKIDIDLPVQTYVPNFPIKKIDGKEVIITTRHLLTHLSGIRHYATKEELDLNPKALEDEMNLKEYYLKEKFPTIESALELFKNDQLLHSPGSKFTYTTHGWTLVSAIIENIVQVPFHKYAKKMFLKWGLRQTYLDEPLPIIPNRVKPYCRDKKSGKLRNSEYVDNSYKWAGGGFISSTVDVLRFAHIMLASLQNRCTSNTESTGSFLNYKTVERIWTGDLRTYRQSRPNSLYALGFYSSEPYTNCYYCSSRDTKEVCHGGAAIGGSSALVITFPANYHILNPNDSIKGVAVAIFTNVTGINAVSTARELIKNFDWMIQQD